MENQKLKKRLIWKNTKIVLKKKLIPAAFKHLVDF